MKKEFRKLCECCLQREVAGYCGNGTVLTRTCLKCYRGNRTPKDNGQQKNFYGYRKGAE